MASFDLENLERKHSHSIDVFVAIGIVAGTIGLFVIDISMPRGELDGVGYAAVVALCTRFGPRSIIIAAISSTILTIGAPLFLPDAGIPVTWMWANRGFAIVEIWTIAAILLRRLWLEAYIVNREAKLRENQTALGTIVREALLPDKPQAERIHRITELTAATMRCDLAAVLQIGDNEKMSRTVDIWNRSTNRHFVIPDTPVNPAPDYRRRMQSEFAVYVDDILQSPIHEARLDILRPLGVRATLVADTFIEQPGMGSIAVAFREPHHWTAQEIAFARGVAQLVALLFAASRNAETLATLDQVSEGIYVEDRNGVIQYANRMAKALSWQDAETPAKRFPRPPLPLTADNDMHEIQHAGHHLEIQRIRLPQGGTLTRINDVTERNAALAVRQQFEARLQQSAKMEAIGQLAGGVAHDFNNILGSIMGFGGFLADDLPERSTERRFAERILSACQRGKVLVEQILAFARARTIERGVVDICLLLKRSQDFLASLLPPQITLTLSLADHALPVFGSRAQIGQLAANLCVNARDALIGEAGAIEITARFAEAQEIEKLREMSGSPNERVFGDWQSGRSYCLLRVADTGSGIAPEILDRVFEPFFTTKGRHRGTGLGLAVVHGVIESTGGICHLASSPGKGTVFSIYFPLANEPRADRSKLMNEPSALRGSERILIVDDEPDIADMLAIGMERLGYETVGVNDPLEALAAFTEQPDAFDIVITDQVMPGMRGLDLIRRLKELKPGIKTILCTGYSEGANAEASHEAGADIFFHKPVDAIQIAPRIRALLDANE
jgi:signal transduction histidine kinase/ActR/RegA family two-component response regulator